MKTTSLLLVRPAPLEDEALTSWVARIAWDNGYLCTRQLLRTMGRTVSSSTDLDLHAPARIVDFLMRSTGQSEQVIQQMTLSSVFARQEIASFEHWHPHWYLHLKSPGKRSIVPRTSFCRLCMQENVKHLRKTWRLSWVTHCAVHDCMLQDSCSQCGAVVETGVLRQRPVYLCEVCSAQLTVGQSHTGVAQRSQRKHPQRDVDWLVGLLQTLPLATLTDLLDTRKDRWRFHIQSHLLKATGEIKLELEELSRHSPSKTTLGRMPIQKREVLFSVLEDMAWLSIDSPWSGYWPNRASSST